MLPHPGLGRASAVPQSASPADLITGAAGLLYTPQSQRVDNHLGGREKDGVSAEAASTLLRERAFGALARAVACWGLRLVGRQGRGLTFLFLAIRSFPECSLPRCVH